MKVKCRFLRQLRYIVLQDLQVGQCLTLPLIRKNRNPVSKKKSIRLLGFLFRIAEGHAAMSDFLTAIPDLTRCIQQNKSCYRIWLGGLEATQAL
jgi:hypothetical protein